MQYGKAQIVVLKKLSFFGRLFWFRCTGYRPIFDGFQTFAKRTTDNIHCSKAVNCTAAACQEDIEELGKSTSCMKKPRTLVFSKEGVTWARLTSLQELYGLLHGAKNRGDKVRVVRGNTSTGVYKPPSADFIADISEIPDLKKVSVDENGITLGGAVTITDFMDLLDLHKDLSPSYAPLHKHLKRVS